LAGPFQDRREYIPVGFGRDILSRTILKRAGQARRFQAVVPSVADAG
jgi:hypothetical protein